MGWSFACDPNFKKADQIAKFRQPSYWGDDIQLLADRVVGNHYWAAIQLPSGRKIVFLALLKGGGRTMGWGYKDTTEDAGPCYYDCPPSLLSLTDEPTEGYAVAWRQKVREHHARKKSRPKPAAGQVVLYGGCKYRLEEPWAPRKGWRVTSLEDGFNYRMNARQLAKATPATEEQTA